MKKDLQKDRGKGENNVNQSRRLQLYMKKSKVKFFKKQDVCIVFVIFRQLSLNKKTRMYNHLLIS